MKKLTYYIMMTAIGFASVSCNSDDPSDATSKHVYQEGEAPYLRSNPAATTALNMEFALAKIDQPQYINLKDYAPVFHKNLNMTVDETISALNNGEAVIYPITPSRQVWNLTAPNYSDCGWYYAANGVGNAENAVFTVNLDKDSKKVEIKAVGIPAVGTMCNVDFGIALKKDAAFDNYVRFTVLASVTDPSKVVTSANIPAGGYNAYSINLRDYAESIQLSMGMTVDELIKALENDQIDIYLCDADGNRVTEADGSHPGYTSGWLGYWIDADGNITGWNGDGYPANLMYLEYGGDGYYNLGNSASSTPTGTQYTVIFDFVNSADPSSFLQFIIAVTFD